MHAAGFSQPEPNRKWCVQGAPSGRGTCVNGRCGRFCCVDEDCGTGATCDPAWVEYRLSEGGIDPPRMGICVN